MPDFFYSNVGPAIQFPITYNPSGNRIITSINIDNQTAATVTLQGPGGFAFAVVGPYSPRSFSVPRWQNMIIVSNGATILSTDWINVQADGRPFGEGLPPLVVSLPGPPGPVGPPGTPLWLSGSNVHAPLLDLVTTGSLIQIWAPNQFYPLLNQSYVTPQMWDANVGSSTYDPTKTRLACQHALDHALAAGGGQGGIAFFPSGTYPLDAVSLVPSSNTRIAGTGNGTVFVPPANSNVPVFQSTTGLALSECWIEDIYIDGEGITGLGTSNHGIEFFNPTRCGICRVRIRWVGGIGIHFPPLNTSFEQHLSWIIVNLLEFCQQGGVLLEGSPSTGGNSDIIIALNEIGLSGLQTPGVWTGSNLVDGLQASDTGGSHKIVGNHVHQSGRYNYNIGGAGDTLLTGNLSEKSGWEGIVIQSSSGCDVTGNRVREVDELATGAHDAITLADASNNVITANRVTGGRYGISESGTSTGNTIDSNNITNFSVKPLFLANASELHDNYPGGNASGYGYARVLTTTSTVSFGTIVNGAIASATIAVTGCQPGDPVGVSVYNLGANGVMVTAFVSSAGNVLIILHNLSGGNLTYNNTPVRLDVYQHT